MVTYVSAGQWRGRDWGHLFFSTVQNNWRWCERSFKVKQPVWNDGVSLAKYCKTHFKFFELVDLPVNWKYQSIREPKLTWVPAVHVTTPQTAKKIDQAGSISNTRGVWYSAVKLQREIMMIYKSVFYYPRWWTGTSEKWLISGGLHALVEPDIYLAKDERKVLTSRIGSLKVMDWS